MKIGLLDWASTAQLWEDRAHCWSHQAQTVAATAPCRRYLSSRPPCIPQWCLGQGPTFVSCPAEADGLPSAESSTGACSLGGAIIRRRPGWSCHLSHHRRSATEAHFLHLTSVHLTSVAQATTQLFSKAWFEVLLYFIECSQELEGYLIIRFLELAQI